MKFHIIFFLSFISLNGTANESIFDKDVLALISKNDLIISETTLCPKDLFGGKEIEYRDVIDDCRISQNKCLKKCLAGDANHCLSLGHVYVDIEDKPIYSSALYTRACKLGAVSACTNRAAAIQRFDEELGEACFYGTFRLTCNKNDEWGCTMQGLSLYKGIGAKKDNDEALKVLKKSCALNQENEACSYAKSIIKNILNETN
jgi:TPR repeat protein